MRKHLAVLKVFKSLGKLHSSKITYWCDYETTLGNFAGFIKRGMQGPGWVVIPIIH